MLSSKTPTCLIFKTLTFILYDLRNHPNIMGARHSCSKYVWIIEEQKQQIKELKEELAEFNRV
jgi:hypothetical protein